MCVSDWQGAVQKVASNVEEDWIHYHTRQQRIIAIRDSSSAMKYEERVDSLDWVEGVRYGLALALEHLLALNTGDAATMLEP